MPSFTVSSQRLSVKPAGPSDLPPAARMGRGPNLDYFTYQSGPRQYGARAATANAAVGLLSRGSEALNEKAIDVALGKWLKGEEAKILTQLDAKGDNVFIVRVNYAVSDGELRTYLWREAFVADTVRSSNDVGKALATLTTEPSMEASPPNNMVKYLHVYLVGTRN